MRKNLTFLILFALIVVITISCEEEKTEINPKIAILGKWEITELGGFPTDAYAYDEYLQDSIYKEHFYETGAVATRKYWLDDSLLYTITVVGSNEFIERRYKYNFIDNNTLHIEKQALATFRTAKYKRIE